MAGNRNRQDAEAARQAARVEQKWVVRVEDSWLALDPAEASKYKTGVSFVGRAGQPRTIIVKHLCGEARPVCVALPVPPDHYIRDEAIKQMDQIVAERNERIEISSKARAERVVLEHVESIEARLAEGGLSAVTLDEMKAVALYRRGPEWVAEVEQKSRERAAGVQEPQQHNPTPEENTQS